MQTTSQYIKNALNNSSMTSTLKPESCSYSITAEEQKALQEKELKQSLLYWLNIAGARYGSTKTILEISAEITEELREPERRMEKELAESLEKAFKNV